MQQPFGVFARELLADYLGLDGRLWRTLGLLLFRPGALTLAYVEGRRTRFLRPFRVYLSATLLFFVTLSLVRSGGAEADFAQGLAEGLSGGGTDAADLTLPAADARARLEAEAARLDRQAAGLRQARADSALQARGHPAVADSLAARAGALRARLAALDGVPDSARVTVPEADLDRGGGEVRAGGGSDIVDGLLSQVGTELPPWMKGRLIRRFEATETPESRGAVVEEAFAAVVGQVPTAMLAMLPLFALLLKGLYVRGGGAGRRAGRGAYRPAPPTLGGGLQARAYAAAVDAANAWRRWRNARHRRRARRPWRRGLRWARHAATPRPLRVRRLGWLRQAVAARRQRFLSEHLVFALHVHAYAFAVFFALLLLDLDRVDPAWGTPAATMLAASVPAHVVLALRRVYAQSWIRTLVKATALLLGYAVVLAFGLVLAAALAARLG